MIENQANDPSRTSWIPVPENSDFPIQNLPFGVFIPEDDIITTGTRIGDTAIDLSALQQLGYFKGIDLPDDVFLQDTLNDFIALGRPTWRRIRNRLAELFDENNTTLKANVAHQNQVLFPVDHVQMLMPVFVQDYTDFYSSIEHATNVGKMFRDPENALLPNWKHLPVGYHGRASSIVVSGTPIHRPVGQTKPKEDQPPVHGPTKRLDFELEIGFVTGKNTLLGQSIPTDKAEEYIFGLVLLNDWSARDIQKWEYVPLGPFLAKNFASHISPWIVTLEALDAFRIPGPDQNPDVLTYLKSIGEKNYDIQLEVSITPEGSKEQNICHSNYKYMYWNMAQQLAHHTVNGCNINVGDLYGSGTISGKDENSYGSMLELAWMGTKPIQMKDKSTRIFIEDGDTVTMRGYGEKNGIRVGFGEVSAKVLASK